MADNTARTFRMSDDTYERFKQFIERDGNGQAHALSEIARIIELAEKKDTDDKDVIEQFENYMTGATRLFLSKLEELKNTRENIRVEYNSVLESQKAYIEDLETRLNDVEALENRIKELTKENAEIREKLDDKSKLNKALETQLSKIDVDTVEKLHKAEEAIKRNEIEHERAMVEMQKKHQEEIERYQQKYAELLKIS